MSEFKELLTKIKKAREDPPAWIPVRYTGFADEFGITQRMYHLLGGDPGTGKTAFADQTYVLDAYRWLDNTDSDITLKTIYFSMERSAVYKKAKWLANRLYTNSELLTSVREVLSMGRGKKISDEALDISETHEDFFNFLFSHVDIYDGIRNPTGIYKIVVSTALQYGTIYGRDENGKYYKIDSASWRKTYRMDNPVPISPSQCPVELKPRNRVFIQDDPKMILQVILDHAGKPRPEQGMNAKQTIDKTSEYLQIARDFYGMNVVVISQFNRNNSDIKRRLNTDLAPEQQDFKGSGNTYEDADVVLGLFNPYKHKIKLHDGYHISKTLKGKHSRFRSVTLLKNSYGVDNLMAGFRFLGECGYFEKLPVSSNLNYDIFNE